MRGKGDGSPAGSEQPTAEGGTDEGADIAKAVGAEIGSPEGFGGQPVDEQAAGRKSQDFSECQDEHAENKDDPVSAPGKTGQPEGEQEASEGQASQQGALFGPSGDEDLQQDDRHGLVKGFARWVGAVVCIRLVLSGVFSGLPRGGLPKKRGIPWRKKGARIARRGGRVPSFAEDVLARRAERYNDFKGILRYLDP